LRQRPARREPRGSRALLAVGRRHTSDDGDCLVALDANIVAKSLNAFDPECRLPNWILYTPDRRVRFRQILARFDDTYDFVLVDTQGTIGPLQDCAVLAGDIPVPGAAQPEERFVGSNPSSALETGPQASEF
jgi:chromosome partitioning related protein ParA